MADTPNPTTNGDAPVVQPVQVIAAPPALDAPIGLTVPIVPVQIAPPTEPAKPVVPAKPKLSPEIIEAQKNQAAYYLRHPEALDFVLGEIESHANSPSTILREVQNLKNDLARRDAIIEFGLSADDLRFVQGNNPDEIKENARALKTHFDAKIAAIKPDPGAPVLPVAPGAPISSGTQPAPPTTAPAIPSSPALPKLPDYGTEGGLESARTALQQSLQGSSILKPEYYTTGA